MNPNRNAVYLPNGRRDEDDNRNVNGNGNGGGARNGGSGNNMPATPSRPTRRPPPPLMYANANGVNGVSGNGNGVNGVNGHQGTGQVEMLADSSSDESDGSDGDAPPTLAVLDYYSWPEPANGGGHSNGHGPNGHGTPGSSPESSSTDSPPRTISTESSFSATGPHSLRLSVPAQPANLQPDAGNTSSDRLSGSTLHEGRGARLHALGPPVSPTPGAAVIDANGRFVRSPNDHPHPNLVRRDPARAPASLGERVLALVVPYLARAAQAAARATSRTARDAVDTVQTRHIVLSYAGNGRVAVRARGGHRVPAIDTLALGPAPHSEALAARRILRILEAHTRVVDVLGNIPTEPTRPGLLFPLAFAALSHLRIIPAPSRGYLPWFPFAARTVVLFSAALVPVRMCPTLAEACRRWETYSPRGDTERVVVVHDGVALSLRACWDGLAHDTAHATFIWHPLVSDTARAPLVPVTLRVLASWQWDVVAELALAFPAGPVRVVGLNTTGLSDAAAAGLAAAAANNNYNNRWLAHDATTFRRIRLLSMSEYARGMDEGALLLDTATGF